jgi:hypothetical protein
MMEIIPCEQGSPEWHAARLGIPTASRFADVLAKGEGKTRGKYLRELAGEIIAGGVEQDTYSNGHMERGKLLEEEARNLYAYMNDVEPQMVGFIRSGRAGASPDSLIGDAGGLEIKTALQHVQVERLQRGTLPPEHKAQVQGSLWITGREWWDFVSYAPRMPLLICRVPRDDVYIAELERAIDAFNEELDNLVSSIRGVDQFRQAAA